MSNTETKRGTTTLNKIAFIYTFWSKGVSNTEFSIKMRLVEAKVGGEKGCFVQIVDWPSTLHMSTICGHTGGVRCQDISTAWKLGRVSGPILEGLCGWCTYCSFLSRVSALHSALHSADSVASCLNRWFFSFDHCWLNTDAACSSLGLSVTSQTAHRELH